MKTTQAQLKNDLTLYTKNGIRDLKIIYDKKQYDQIAKEIYQIIQNQKPNLAFTSLGKILLAKIYDELTTPAGGFYQCQIHYPSEKPRSIYNRIDALYRGYYLDNGIYSDCALKRLPQPKTWKDKDLPKAKKIALSSIQVKNIIEILQNISLTAYNYKIFKFLSESLVKHLFRIHLYKESLYLNYVLTSKYFYLTP